MPERTARSWLREGRLPREPMRGRLVALMATSTQPTDPYTRRTASPSMMTFLPEVDTLRVDVPLCTEASVRIVMTLLLTVVEEWRLTVRYLGLSDILMPAVSQASDGDRGAAVGIRAVAELAI